MFIPGLRQQILGVESIATNVAGMVVNSVIDIATNSQSPQEMVAFEVENDINAFEEYLRFAIFDAAGFNAFLWV